MASNVSDIAPPQASPAPAKIVVAGGFGVGQDHLRRCGVGDRAPGHRGRDDRGGRRGRRPPAGPRQDHDHRRHGLRADLAALGPDPLPVRHARAGAVLVHVGRPRARGDRCRGARRHPPARRVLRGHGLLRGPRAALRRRRQLLRRARRHDLDEVREAMELPAGTPLRYCDARHRESTVEMLVVLVRHAMARAS